MMYWGHEWGNWGWWMVFPMIFMVLFWGGLIWLLVWGVRRWTHHAYHGTGNTPLDIAKTRYAKGEITKEQFEEIKKNLQN